MTDKQRQSLDEWMADVEAEAEAEATGRKKKSPPLDAEGQAEVDALLAETKRQWDVEDAAFAELVKEHDKNIKIKKRA